MKIAESSLKLPQALWYSPTFGELAMRAMRRYGDRTALVDAYRSYSYRQMSEQIGRLMRALCNIGVGRQSGLCVLASNRPEALFVRIAASLLGARFTALHPLGSVQDHRFVLDDSRSDVLIFDPAYASHVAQIAHEATDLTFACLGAGQGIDLLVAAANETESALWCDAEPDDLWGLVYTGGTTGHPKGIAHTHLSVVMSTLISMAEWEWPSTPRLLAMTPLSHAAGGLVLPVLLKGGTIFLQDGFSPDSFFDSVQEHRINVTFLVPTMIYALLDHSRLRAVDLSSLSLIIYGAAPMSPRRLKEALGVFGPVFMQLYGQSEAPMTVTTLNTWDHVDSHSDRLTSCGVPTAGVQVRLLDDEGRRVAMGDTGEICVRGPIVMQGYWRDADESLRAFEGGWLRTGDMAREDEEGFFHIVDRKKDVIITGGFNVFPKEVEDVLTSHPSVAEAAVVPAPHPKWGEAVAAFVVLRVGSTANAEELTALVRQRKGVVYAPKQVHFVSALPKTALGKPDKKALRAAYQAAAERPD